VVIGLGSGRSGTASLASLIDQQPGGLCFHEMNPSGTVFSGNPQSSLNTVAEFQAILAGGARNHLSIDYSRPASVATFHKLQQMPSVRLLGDIGFYYLNYVEDILERAPQCKFVCLRRDREETVQSWLKKSTIRRWRSLWLADKLKSWLTRAPFYTEFNHWQAHDGSKWMQDEVWDSCFPDIQAATKEDAIRQYWDDYYREAERLQQVKPESFRIFDIADLSHETGQQKILEFIGLDPADMVCPGQVHLHKSS